MSLLNLGGTIPVKYRDDTYNIPGIRLVLFNKLWAVEFLVETIPVK